MDPLSSLSVASSILQLVDFGGKLLAGTRELYNSADGASAANRELEIATSQLNIICSGLSIPPEKYLNRDAGQSELALIPLAQSCRELGDELLSVLRKLKLGDRRRKWATFRQAFLSIWRESKIRDYEKRLGQYRSLITIHLTSMLSSQVAAGQSHIMESLAGIAASNDRIEATTIYTAAQSLDRQSSLAKFLDDLTASHRRLEISGANASARLRKDVLETLRHFQTEDGNQDFGCKSTSLMHLEGQLSALKEEARRLARDVVVIKSLSFAAISERKARIREVHPNTFNWIFRPQRSQTTTGEASPAETESDCPLKSADYHVPAVSTECMFPMMNWLQNGDGVYWISGKAGSGKSTLMKFLHNHEKTLAALRSWAGEKKLVTANFFFWNLGTDLQKSQQGLLQTLLYHILRQCPTLVSKLCSESLYNDDLQELEWSHVEMFGLLQDLSRQTLDTSRFCFFIDGLDEFEGDHSEVIQLVNKLASAVDIKIVVSSRPWNVFEDAYGVNHGQKLILQDLTRNDITRFVKENLQEDQRFRDLEASDNRYEDLVEEIVARASGVFLWVFLTVRSLRRGLTNADTVPELQHRLRILPTELEMYFHHMLSSVEKVYHKQVARLLLMRLSSPPTLTVMSASNFDDESPDFGLAAEIKPFSWEQIGQRVDVASRRIRARCIDLLQVYGDKPGEVQVNFLHRTVYEYLETPEIRRLLLERAGADFDVNRYFCNTMLFQIKTLPTQDGSPQMHPPINFLVAEFMCFAEGMDLANNSDYRHLDELERTIKSTRETYLSGNMIELQRSWPFLFLPVNGIHMDEDWLLSLAIYYGLNGYLSTKSDQFQRLIKKQKLGLYSPLSIALRLCGSHWPVNRTNIEPRTVETLLKQGASPNEGDPDFPVWCEFLSALPKDSPPDVRRPHLTVAELLVRNGARLPQSTTLARVLRNCAAEEAAYLQDLIALPADQASKAPKRRSGFRKWLLEK
ncbi:MAG: hypothetical protein Q9168_007862 [Polycauliona sp. 1 TL-2023]